MEENDGVGFAVDLLDQLDEGLWKQDRSGRSGSLGPPDVGGQKNDKVSILKPRMDPALHFPPRWFGRDSVAHADPVPSGSSSRERISAITPATQIESSNRSVSGIMAATMVKGSDGVKNIDTTARPT